MAASIYDVAKRAGVSISTVSRILNHSANVSDKKVAAVQEAMEYYQYEPNQFGRGLVKQKSNMVGVYFPVASGSVFDSSYNLEVLKGIEKVLSYQNYSMVLICETEDYGSRMTAAPKYMEYIKQKKIDGLILSGLTDKAVRDAVFQQIIEEDYPAVYIGKRLHQKGLNVYAQFEIYQIQMLKHLYQNGHRKVLFYIYVMHLRYLAVIQKQADEAMPDLKIYPCVLDDYIHARDQLVQDVKRYVNEEGCTAIVSPGMETTHQILGVCAEMKLAVPEQVSIVSVEHRKGEGQLCYPPVSSFYVPAKDMGSGAVSLLLNKIHESDTEEVSIEYETKYIERESIRRI